MYLKLIKGNTTFYTVHVELFCNMWNSLPQDVIGSMTVARSKKGLGTDPQLD